MLQFLSKIFGGSKSEKDVKRISPVIQQTRGFFEAYSQLSNDALRAKTVAFKTIIQERLATIDSEILTLSEQAEALPADDYNGKDLLYKQVDDLRKSRNQQIEKVLEEIMPQAFAVVKETARRLSLNTELVSAATPLDRELAIKKEYIRIEGDTTYFKNTWMAAGIPVTWNMVHYDVQLIGGAVLHEGKISEMATGEGKTLVSTLPAYLNALAGEGVHIVTVNDYLSRRDSEWNGPLFEWLGLTVDCIDKHDPNSDARRKAYRADITYGTNNEFGFDYLRDNMVHTKDEMVQRRHHFAMVDEVDSVLIDDARTPLIISGPVPKGDEQQYHILKPRINQLVEVQKQVVTKSLIEAKKRFAEGKDEPADGGLHLMRAFRGLPKNTSLIKFTSEPGIKVKLQKAENYFLADQQKNMPQVDEELYFHIDEKNNQVELTDKGLQYITKSGEDPTFFILPDLSILLSDIEKTNHNAEEKLRQKELVIQDYSQKAERIHTIQQLLKAYSLFDKDVEYVVMDGQVKIVDEQTGRILDGRRYSDGLHQAIEAKENVKIEAATQTYATITLQNYFRMYHKLAGMTGTAETEAGEFWNIYKLDVVTIPTNLSLIRIDSEDLVFKTKREKYKAIIEEIEQLREAKRPVLVGTTSVEVSELLSRMMQQKKIPHNVLNAKQHAKEAQIVAEAGLAGNITIATNMAGRGTDIKLGPGVKEAGGLAIVGTEKHDSRRVDRQLRGRAGRQGDPGSSQFYISLEDELMRMFGSDRIASLMDRMGYKEGEVIQHKMITQSIERAQKKVEENNFGTRKRLLEYDDVMNKQRNVVYAKRQHALFGERLAVDIDNAFYGVAAHLVASYKEQNDFDGFKLAIILNFGIETSISKDELYKADPTDLAESLYQEAINSYTRKKQEMMKQSLPVFENVRKMQGAHINNVVVPFTDGKRGINVLVGLDKAIKTKGLEIASALERTITLSVIDDTWKEHLRSMDDLKQSVQTAVYEQKDPLVIYKTTAFELFSHMTTDLNKEIVSFLCYAGIPINDENAQLKEGKTEKTDMSKMKLRKDELIAEGRNAADAGIEGSEFNNDVQEKQEPVRVGPKVGRNDLCPCGSGKKYKNCHGKEEL
jgi:preprotein translocase subunit SecA